MWHFLELEEQVGWGWHRLVGTCPSYPSHPQAAVELAEIRAMLAVFFRGLGGSAAVELSASGAEESGHRLTWRQRLGMAAETLPVSSLSEAALRLPDRIDLFPDADQNRSLYLWLAAFFAAAKPPQPDHDEDLLRRDLRALIRARATTARTLAAYPGLRDRHATLAAAVAGIRPRRPLSEMEALVESCVSALLRGQRPAAGGGAALYDLVSAGDETAVTAYRAPRRYRPFLPVPLWGEVRPHVTQSRPSSAETGEDGSGDSGGDDRRKRKARRKTQDQADRDDPMILNRMEKILMLAEMVNVNRGDDDDDDQNARKAADDMEEITVSPHSKKTAARIRLDLDLPPDAVTGGALTGGGTYPEWDYRRAILLPDHCRVMTGPATEEGGDWAPDETARRLIVRVRRQFEALRPRLITHRGQADGDDLDLEALVRSRVDLHANGSVNDRVYLKTRASARDLSVAVLMDVSLSTDAWIDNRRVLDVEKEALSVFLSGLNACGDENAVFTFTSRRRDWVRVQTVKDFDEPFGPAVLRRVAALKPGYYTRMGAAIRHAAAQLEKRPHGRRLLLVLTDGKPNDIDHYEGRFGIEDSRHAILEARRKGLAVFGVTIDAEARDYFPALFGRGRYAIVSDLSRLSQALPRLYQGIAA
ncbi:nitric oxide reductase activation protein NorD [Novispirillum itersonii]|uniref:nitric oxide reductase activation protein NorD n=1 Tax=Novispirillum itersonii TaxID=189 RepID=UPI00036F74C5|nr:VWA domain-containing protein [Novispirillum itersonii]